MDKLFGGGNRSMAVFPLRAVYMAVPKGDVPVSILVSVPKRKFHRSVDRNRMKRQIREAYRCNKDLLWETMESRGESLAIAFICISDAPCETSMIRKSVVKILQRIREQYHE